MFDWLIPTLLVLSIVVTFITLVGHGIWVLLAKLFGARRQYLAGPESWPQCPRCDARLQAPARCPECGWTAKKEVVEAGGVQTARQQVDILRRQKLISADVHRQVVEALAASQRPPRIATPAVAAAPPAGPLIAPAAPATAATVPPIVADLVKPREKRVVAPQSPLASPAAVVPSARAAVPLAPTSVRERADRYQQQRAAAAVAAEPAPAASVPAPPPQAWLASFMEEKHIRWGELVGGLLIVCSSIALVISFWNAIAERPLLKFGVLNGMTAALFGLGLYAARRWKLPTTSQGILLISTLLVPLNFLAIAAFSRGAAPLTLPVLAGEAISTLLLGTLVFLAARIITPAWPITVTAGVVLPAVGQLLIRRHLDADATTGLLYAFALPGLAIYLASQVPVLWSRRDGERLTESQGNELLKQLGLISFSLLVALGLLLAKAGQPAERLQWLAPLSVLLAAPAMSCGLLLWKRPGVVEQELRMAGTTLAVMATCVAVAGLVLAWPQPILLLVCSALICVTLTLLAWWYEIDAAHWVAAGLAAVSGVLLLQILRTDVPWTVSSPRELIGALWSASSGRALTVVAFALLGVACWLSSRACRLAALGYAAVGTATAGLGLLLVAWFGWGRAGDPEQLTWLVGGYGIVASVAAFRWHQAWAQRVAGLLLLAAIAQGLVYGPWPIDLPRSTLWLLVLLSHATLLGLMATVSGSRRVDARDAVLIPSAAWSLGSAALAALVIVADSMLWSRAVPTGYVTWIALILLNLAWACHSYTFFAAFQAALAVALMAFVDHRLQMQPWYVSAEPDWLHPIRLQWQGIALASYGAVWSCLRLAGARRAQTEPAGQSSSSVTWLSMALRTDWVHVDRVVVGVALLLLILLAIHAVVPGIAQELSPVVGSSRVVPSATQFQLLGLPHAPAGGPLTWVLCGTVMLAFLLGLRERPELDGLTGLILAASTLPLLAAAQWESQVAVASALRWTSAIFFLTSSVLVWLRRPLADGVRAWGLITPLARGSAGLSFSLLLVLATLPVLAMAVFVLGQALSAHPVVGPDPTSFFARIGLAASYAVPLSILSLALIGHAISFRSEPLAFAAGLLLSFSATAAYLLGSRVSGALTAEQWVRLAQLNAMITAIYGIAWLGFVALRRWRRGTAAAPLLDGWHGIQRGIAAGFLLLPVLVTVAAVFVSPITPAIDTQLVVGLWGWTASALVAAYWIASHRLRHGSVSSGMLLGLTYLLLTMAALQGESLQTGLPTTSWLTYHLLQLAAAAAGLAAAGFGHWELRRTVAGPLRAIPGQSVLASDAALSLLPLGALGLLSLRSVRSDPLSHWWSVLGLVTVAGLSIERGWRLARHRYLWLAALLLNVAASTWFIRFGHKLLPPGPGLILDLIYLNVVALALPVPLWSVLSQPQHATGRRRTILHLAAAFAAILLYGLATALGLLADATRGAMLAQPWSTAMALAAIALASFSCLYDPRSRWSVAFCYLTGLAATATLLDRLNVDATAMTWLSTLLLSAFGVAASYLWSRREGLWAVVQRLGVPDPSVDRLPSQSWLVPLNGLLALTVCGLGVWVQFSCEHAGLRLAASQAVAAQTLAMGLLARGRRETELRYYALLIGVVAAVCFGWSWLSPDAQSSQWLNRWVVLSVSLLGTAVFYGFGLVKLVRRENAWTTSAARLVPGLVGAGVLSTLCVLGSEAYLLARDGSAYMAWPGIVAVAAALLVSAAAALLAAVVPGRDPLGLTEKQRTLYVYGAEALLALFCLHLRVTVPELFTGFVQRYWTVVVMGLAFLGVGLSEWFRRRQQMVLAEPLERTGVLLPLLPVLAFWVTPQQVHYSLVLLGVGGLYAALSIMRRSFGFGLLAVLAANGGLWYFLQKTAQIGFYEHPQLWLVPLATCVLVAAYLNREQLSTAQLTSIRYLTSSVIYTASTADIFIHGVAEAPWLPMILAGLSILGIFVGIWLRVRAFLYLGLSFLLVSLLTVIWHAAVDLHQTWLWFASGIVLGLLILALFGMFERKRQEVLQLVDQIKTWES